MNDLYQDVIMDHYRYPRNNGYLDAPEASYEDENPLCADTIRIDLSFDPPLVQDAARSIVHVDTEALQALLDHVRERGI